MANSQSKRPEEKGKRYQGYDVDKVASQGKKRNKPWFWKVLAISLVLTAVIISVACFVAMRSKKQQTDYLSSINESNTIDLLLEDHSNVTITQSFSKQKELDDYKSIRFLKKSEKGVLYSYLKTEGLEEDYKEVLTGKNLYRFDGSYAYYYGLVANDYEEFLEKIQADVIQLNGSERVQEQVESTDVMKVTMTYECQAGDFYTKHFDIQSGDTIQKVLTIDKETLLITADVESVNGEEFYKYSIAFDGDNKDPVFYRNIREKHNTRNCVVYYDYEDDNEEKYNYTIKVDTYFALLPHEGYKVYMDSACTTEFSKMNMQTQNPYTDITLYMKKGE